MERQPQRIDPIRCVECGGDAYPSVLPGPEGWHSGDVVPFVCVDCHHRHDIVTPGDDHDDPDV